MDAPERTDRPEKRVMVLEGVRLGAHRADEASGDFLRGRLMMRYPRLSQDDTDVDSPQTLRFPRSVPGRGADRRERLPHEAERAVERVQECLTQLDALMDAIPFRRDEPEDDGPRAA